jgi:transcription termination factor NusB
VTETEFLAELQHLAAQELTLWRSYQTRRAEAEEARDEAAAELLENPTSAAARKRYLEAAQTASLLDGGITLLRRRREKLLTEYFESYVAAIESRRKELEAEIANLAEKRKQILSQLTEIEGAEFIALPKNGQATKTEILKHEVQSLHNRLILARQYGVPRAGVAFGDNLDELLDKMLKTPSIVPSCDQVSNCYRTIEAHVQRGERVATWRIVWRRGALYREACFAEVEPGKWLTLNESGKVSVTYDPNRRRLADLPVPVWLRLEGPELLALTK